MAKRIRLTKYQCEQLARSILHDLHQRFEVKREEIRKRAEADWMKSQYGRMVARLAKKYCDRMKWPMQQLAGDVGQQALKHWANPIKLRSNEVNRIAARVAVLAVEMDTCEEIATTIRKEELRKVSKRQRRKFGVPIA